MEIRKLRSGYTTGTCGAAAVTAAAWYIFTGQERMWCQIPLPGGQTAKLPVKKAEDQKDGRVWFFAEKDAGDDPDVTNGVRVYGTIEKLNQENTEKSAPEGNIPAWYHSEEYPFLFLTGGPGIGVVTRPGLACPVGYYAINPVPRAMIFQQAGRLYEELGMKGNYLISLMIPEGIRLAERTFNPKLGIRDGISVLGTSGVVRPMSEQALKDTIRLEIHMKAVSGEDSLILVPGNYGERFLKENLGISPEYGVHCSNFVADAITMCVEEQMKEILFIGHIGKLIKVAGGAKNTHSRFGDRRMEILAECFVQAAERKRGPLWSEEAIKETKEKIISCNTTEEVLDYLGQKGFREPVMEVAVRRIWQQMNQWGEGKINIQILTFSSIYGILGMSSLCGPMIEKWRKRQT